MSRQIYKEIRFECLKPDPNNPNAEPWVIAACCVVRSNCYGSLLDTILEYAAIARQTYPNLRDEDIRIIHFGGQIYARTFGIMFVPEDGKTLHEGWTAIKELEHTL
jgi:hypothetical protein